MPKAHSLTATQKQVDRLSVLADRIRSACGNALGHAIEAGDCLIEAKSLVPHGEWLPWLRKHCKLSARHAQRLMRLAKHKGLLNVKSDTGSHLTPKAVLALLRPPAPAVRPVPDSAGPRASRPPTTKLQIAKAEAQKARAVAVALMFPPPDTCKIPSGTRAPLIEALSKLASSNPAERAEAAAAAERERARLSMTWDQLIVPAAEVADIAEAA